MALIVGAHRMGMTLAAATPLGIDPAASASGKALLLNQTCDETTCDADVDVQFGAALRRRAHDMFAARGWHSASKLALADTP